MSYAKLLTLPDAAPADNAVDAYVDLMREIVLNTIYDPEPFKADGSIRPAASGINTAFSMVGRRRLDNVRDLIRAVVEVGVPGDVVETGSWKGGCMFMAAAVLRSLGVSDRGVYLADSFEGIPKPTADQKAVDIDKSAYTKNLGDDNSPELAAARAQRLGVEPYVHIVPGYFNETLPKLVAEKGPQWKVAVLRLDGDTYFSTMEALTALYENVTPGGYIIVDDYMDWHGCFSAIRTFRRHHKVDDPLVSVYYAPKLSGETMRGVYWRKHGHDPCEPQGAHLQRWLATDPDLPGIYTSSHHIRDARDADELFFNPAIDPLHKCVPNDIPGTDTVATGDDVGVASPSSSAETTL
eukprot:CAMPEP_0118914216 /NCGR_PEP_ID=MMETSP1166-20130328/14653_1 /TAXON_ID=1104430 /ORGANISM="Chrysoreinhardia sp, Strain CCMP3193" /LENGTH=351 /DNA_ID=CAMNT_0006853785 /DNA_START=316 /DNA_END=1371 /DNA_ORIENTATION=-